MEMVVRSAMHRAGATALTELLEFSARSDANALWLVLAVNSRGIASCAPNRC
jgi:hypothetical protein